jgi:hypothetical protein
MQKVAALPFFGVRAVGRGSVPLACLCGVEEPWGRSQAVALPGAVVVAVVVGVVVVVTLQQ